MKEMMVEFLGGPLDGHLQIIEGDEDNPESELELTGTEGRPSSYYYFWGHRSGMTCVYMDECIWDAFIKNLKWETSDGLGLGSEDEE